jgi:propionyl-CoA carboxylase alpha chain
LPSQDQTVSFESGPDHIDVFYRFGRGSPSVKIDDWSADVRVIGSSATLLDAEIDGIRRRYQVKCLGTTHYVDSSLGSTALVEVARFPDRSVINEVGSLLAPMPAAVVRVEVDQGVAVSAGTPIVVLEAMKMEHTVRAPAEGVVVAILVTSGQQVDSGQVLAIVRGDDE